ncbi:carboxypeptidase-like regulatory domain-containing protein [uncultured Kordia sp.]|uniref:T9SS type A sorting domain-containing protein n=1 Tax=uncultured Kordia sp. TaxID=507699 RepID=UPI0026316298|nr:carboxypeptidase-like regulatory domain-containing protein [uncultured Kordia sp.]
MKSTLLFGLFLSFSICCFAQKVTITGTVYDAYKNTIPYANVIVKNTPKGVITNEEGQFSIAVDPTAVLEVSYVGFETQEIFAGKHNQVSIILERNIEELDAVTVVGYSSYCRSNLMYCTLVTVEPGDVYSYSDGAFDRISSKQRITSLFPNPSANGLFQLQLDKTYAYISIEVYNMNGQLLQTTTHSNLAKIPRINLSNQPKGMYLVRVKADGKLLETKKAVRI